MFYLSLRQLLSRKKQTVLILLGISLGTMIYILIAGIQLGMREYMAGILLNNTSHIRISGDDKSINSDNLREQFYGQENLVNWISPPYGKRDMAKLDNYHGWVERLEADPDVFNFAPRLNINILVTHGNNRANAGLSGIVPSRHIKITDLEDYMKDGSFLDLEGGLGKIILGSGLAEKIGVRKNDNVNLAIGLGANRPYRVVGILHMGNKQIDDVIAYANIKDVQILNKTPGRVSEIAVALLDMDKSQALADKWSLFTKDKVESWEEANASFMQIINVQDISRLVITIAILIVAAFGIYNVLTIMISQKKREIAILRSIGYGPGKILELFLIQGMILGVFGGFIGLCLGHVLNLYIESIDLGFSIGKGNHLIISYDPAIYLTAFWAAQGASFLASFLPAYQASKLTPIDIIRSE